MTIRSTTPRWRVPVVLAGVALVCVAAILLTATDARAASFTWSTPKLVNVGTSKLVGGGSSPLVGAQTSPIPSISCPSINLCVAVSGSDVYTSTAPGADYWTANEIDTSSPLDLVSCWAGSSCVAIDAAGYVFFTESPSGGTWLRSRYSIDNPSENVGGGEITGLSCLADGCVAVDARGSVLTQSGPSPIGAWLTTSYVVNGESGSYDSLAAVSCTLTFCVAANAHGWLFANKTADAGAWTSVGAVRTGYDISSVSCLSGGLCVVTGPHETTTDETLNPFGGGSAWSVHWNSDPATYPQPTDVSCASATLCVGVADNPLGIGYAEVSSSPRFPGSFTGRAAVDQAVDVPGSGGLDAISCAAGTDYFAGEQVCAISDGTGHLITGTYNPRYGDGG